jgi:hypothetical protein
MIIDPQIRDYVLLPLFIFVAFSSMLRMTIFKLLQPQESPTMDDPEAHEKKVDEMKSKGVIARSMRLRTNGGYITPQGFDMRKSALVGRVAASGETRLGLLKQPQPDPPAPDPMAMMQGGGGMMGMMVQQLYMTGIYYIIQVRRGGWLAL